MIRYLWDAMVYAVTPAWFQPLIVFASVIIVPVLLQTLGWLWGSLAIAFIEVGVFDKLSQPNVFTGNISANFYIALGVSFSLFIVYFMYVHSYVSTFSSLCVVGGTSIMGIIWYLCVTTKPKYKSCSDKEITVFQLLACSPAEGPADDNKKSSAATEDSRWNAASDDVEAGKPLIACMDENEVEAFSLCTHCIVDKAGSHHCNVSPHYSHVSIC